MLSGSQPVLASDLVYRLVGGSFAACGLIAWHRRPDSRGGALMMATGFGFLLVSAAGPDRRAARRDLAMFVSDIWIFAFLPLVLTNLSGGRLRSRVDWVLIAAFALPLLVLQFVWLLLLEQEGNVLGVFPDAGAADAVDKTQRALCAVAAVATAGVLAIRWRAASRPLRRAMLPSLAGTFALIMFTSLLVNDLDHGLALGDPAVDRARLAGHRARGVPVRAAALAARAPRPRGPAARLRHDARREARWRARSATRARVDQSLRGSPTRRRRPSRPGPGRAVTPVERDGREVAALVYDAALDDDPELVEAVRAAAAIALENERLHAESEAALAELRASRERLVAAGDAERRRLERNLHDGAQQRLVALSLQLRMIQGRIRARPASAEHSSTPRATSSRSRSRSSASSRAASTPPCSTTACPPRWRRSPTARRSRRSSSARAGERLPEAVELAAYFVASEALANVAKYSQAEHASIRLTRTGGVAVIQIADNGIGGADERAARACAGSATASRRSPAGSTSPARPGAGTVVTAELPVG